MVLAKSPLFRMIKKGFKIVDIRYRKRGQIEVGMHRVPFNPRTPAQTKQRTWYGQMVEEWRGLTQDEKDEWDEKAKPFFISGFNYFLQTWVPVVVGLKHIATKDVTNAATVTFDGLNGDEDFCYCFLIKGRLFVGGADRFPHIEPSPYLKHLMDCLWIIRDRTTRFEGSDTKYGLTFLRTYYAKDADIYAFVTIIAKTGNARLSTSNFTWWLTDNSAAAMGNMGSICRDVDSNFTSLEVDFDGGTFTGTIRLYKFIE